MTGRAVAALALALLAVPAQAQDGAEFVVRLNRVEGQMRQLSGQVEQLQFENRQLKEQLRKFQEDVEFRFQERGGRAAAPAPSTTQPSGQPPAGSRPERPPRRGDAFDPALDPGAPGAPRPLGSAQAIPPAGASAQRAGPEPRGGIAAIIDSEDDDAPSGRRPLDLGAAGRPGPSSPPQANALPPRASEPAAGPASGRGPGAAAATTDDPRADYDVAYAYLIQRQHDRAETAFRGFLQAHPRDRLVPDATFWLGESFLQRNRPREAAEQFLKVSTEHARSAKAPDALLKLGVSLAALGAKDQACATFAEVERKFPGASTTIKQGVDREQKRVRCPA